MQALRTRAVGVARRARPTTLRPSRSYASDSHGHGHHEAPKVEEGLGTAFYLFVAAVPASIFGYQISRPGANGEPSSFSKWLEQFDYFNDWEARNTRRTDLLEQAAHDKHLFFSAGRNTHVELKTPELMFSGSPYNVPAGHFANMDQVTAHYRKQAEAEEERKAKKLIEKRAAEAEAEAKST
ncbi:putative NADH-ubiquinone oxidoreductase kDa subunit [Rosellinia necatrix]|uniref:Putative NADH-ubiquinone oxidoreductase kDa subunit n=1 Tax=Rosellinia necatrix TaxID=77044 RepID=A0A1W2TGR0_ROSNE|nr:putative NADH-ubiquinone oxidoreductase kDa subunit [Rosellinia necatrix]